MNSRHVFPTQNAAEIFRYLTSITKVGKIHLPLIAGCAFSHNFLHFFLTGNPGRVDVVSALVVAGRVEEDSGIVRGEEVRAPVLDLIADLQRRRELRFRRVI